jgi:hypothetical protein
MIKMASFRFWRETVDFQIVSFDLEKGLSVLLGKEKKRIKTVYFADTYSFVEKSRYLIEY